MFRRAAAGAAIIVALLSMPAVAGEVLTAEQIRAQLIGNTFSGLMEASEGGPSPYSEYYDPDGTIRGDGYAGHWTIEGNSMCLAYEQSPKECWQVGTAGEEVRWILNGAVQGTGKIAPGNPNNF